MKTILSLLTALACAGLVGCSPKTPKAVAARTAERGNSTATNAFPIWNWDTYPAVKKMRLGLLPCSLQPRSQITIQSTLAGALKLYVTSAQTNIESGTVWGEFEPAIFELEAASLQESKTKLDEREKLLLELEIPKQRLQLERSIEEMQRQVAMVRFMTTNRESADLILSAGDSTSLLRPDSLLKKETELRLLSQNLSYLEQTNMALIGVDLPGMRSQWERQRLEFERRRSQATLKMPFKGQLTVSLALAEGLAEYPVNVGQELGVARDLSTVRVRVPIANSAWNSLPAENLSVIMRLPNGGEMEAPFAYQKIERVQSREESAYYFQFLPEHTATVARLIGTDVTCELWFNLGQATRIVPKLALIMHNPGAFQAGNWSAGLTRAFPGSRLAVEGQTDLGIVLPNRELKQASR